MIEYAKPYLKQRGFKKKNKRWTKNVGKFTLCFYIQGSCWDKDDYYIRPGVFVNDYAIGCPYGHFWFTISNSLSPEKIFEKFDAFCLEWTDVALIKVRAKEHKSWLERNPLEKRRAGLIDYEKDPRSDVLIQCGDFFIDYLIDEL